MMLCYTCIIKVPLLRRINGHFLPIILILVPQVSNKMIEGRYYAIPGNCNPLLLAMASHIESVIYQINL